MQAAKKMKIDLDPSIAEQPMASASGQMSLNYFFGGKEPEHNLAKKYGFKVYGPLEIEAAKGKLEKEFRQFWNREVETIARDARLRKIGKQEVHGIINTAWTLHKSTLLKLETKRLELLEEKVLDTNFRTHRMEDSITRNIDRMEIAHAAIETTHNRLKDVKSSLVSLSLDATVKHRDALKREIDVLESRLSADIPELKKSQDALRKASSKRMTSIQDQLRKEDLTNVSTIDSNVDEAEVTGLVEEVRQSPVAPLEHFRSVFGKCI